MRLLTILVTLTNTEVFLEDYFVDLLSSSVLTSWQMKETEGRSKKHKNINTFREWRDSHVRRNNKN